MIQKVVGGGDHLLAKAEIQRKYFGFEALDDSVCLMGFVGRITSQKGVIQIDLGAFNLRGR